MIEREPDHRKLSTKLKTKSNKPYRKKRKNFNRADYERNTAMAAALKDFSEQLHRKIDEDCIKALREPEIVKTTREAWKL